MTIVSGILRSALRESNSIAAVQDPTVIETGEALGRLQALVLSTLGGDAGYIMEDWNVRAPATIVKPNGVPLNAAQAAAYAVAPNARLICSLTAPTALALDPMPQDGQRFSIVDVTGNFATVNLTLNPNGRKLDGSAAAVALNTNSLIGQWFYRSDIAEWLSIAPLDAEAEFPFPEDFDDYFIISLAMRLNPRFGKQLDEQSKARLAQQQQLITVRYSQTRLAVGAPAQEQA